MPSNDTNILLSVIENIPINTEAHAKREAAAVELATLMIRDPSFKSFFKGLGHDVEQVAPAALSMASKFLKREAEAYPDPSPEEVATALITRDPSFKSFFKGLGHDIEKVAPEALSLATKVLKRDPTPDEVALVARDPSFKSFFKGLGHDIEKVAPAALSIATKVLKREASADEVASVVARDPNFKSFMKGLGHDVEEIAPTVLKIGSKFL
jgi:hypothetical protein